MNRVKAKAKAKDEPPWDVLLVVVMMLALVLLTVAR